MWGRLTVGLRIVTHLLSQFLRHHVPYLHHCPSSHQVCVLLPCYDNVSSPRPITVEPIWTTIAELRSMRALLTDVKHGPNFEDLIAALAVHLGLATVVETAEASGRYSVSMGTKEQVQSLFAQVNYQACCVIAMHCVLIIIFTCVLQDA